MGDGAFLADLPQVRRDRLAPLATEIGATAKASRLPEAVAERQVLARTTAQAPWLGAGFIIHLLGCTNAWSSCRDQGVTQIGAWAGFCSIG